MKLVGAPDPLVAARIGTATGPDVMLAPLIVALTVRLKLEFVFPAAHVAMIFVGSPSGEADSTTPGSDEEKFNTVPDGKTEPDGTLTA